MRKYRLTWAWLAVFGLAVSTGPALAADKVKINFVLDWIVGGRHSGWFTALHKGFYEDEGLDVTISRGFGTSRGIDRMAAGQAEISFGDIGTMILARAKEGVKIKAVSVSYAKHPSAIFVHGKYNIKTPKDLEGKTLIDSAGSTNVVMFPVYAKLAGFDASKVEWVLVAPDAKMQAFKAEKGHGVLFYNMQLPMMKKITADQSGVNMLEFGDYMKIYSNGILVTEDYLAKNPDAVRRFVRASMKGWEYTFAHVDEAVELLLRDHQLLDADVAKAETLIVKSLMQSPEAMKNGLGYMDPDRIRETRDLMLRLFNVDATVPLEDIYTNDFLPKKPS